MEAMLAQKGIKSKIAENGQIALDIIKSGSIYDIVFMDINMPIMNGIEATHAIIKYEEENNLDHIPIVALTANAVAGDRENFLKEGMDSYIPKPFEEYMLDEVLNKYIKLENKNEKMNVEEIYLKKEEDFEYSIENAANALGLKLPIFKTILKTFVFSINNDLEELRSYIKSKNLEQVKLIAHKIKGASGNLKINNIYEITKDIELSAKEGLEVDYSSKLKMLEKCAEKLKKLYEENS